MHILRKFRGESNQVTSGTIYSTVWQLEQYYEMSDGDFLSEKRRVILKIPLGQ